MFGITELIGNICRKKLDEPCLSGVRGDRAVGQYVL
jgi:hypothetical protein